MTLTSLVYVLCFLTCTVCAALFLRAWLRTGTRLLLWTAISLGILAINNSLVIADLLIFPDANLLVARSLVALTAGSVLIFGLIWESD